MAELHSRGYVSSRRCATAGRQLLRELGEALRMLNHERSTRCVVVRSSTPGVFCAGADLKARSWLLAVLARAAISLSAREATHVHEAPSGMTLASMPWSCSCCASRPLPRT